MRHRIFAPQNSENVTLQSGLKARANDGNAILIIHAIQYSAEIQRYHHASVPPHTRTGLRSCCLSGDITNSANTGLIAMFVRRYQEECGDDSALSSCFHLIGPAPGNDGNAALFAMFVWRRLEDPVPPQHVDIAGKHVRGPVRLRHRYHRLEEKTKNKS
jgi:hypothetical protein